MPVLYYANGGSSYLERQGDMACDVLAVDWAVDMATARKVVGPDRVLQGNVDPTLLFGSDEQVRRRHSARQASPPEAQGRSRSGPDAPRSRPAVTAVTPRSRRVASRVGVDRPGSV